MRGRFELTARRRPGPANSVAPRYSKRPISARLKVGAKAKRKGGHFGGARSGAATENILLGVLLFLPLGTWESGVGGRINQAKPVGFFSLC